MKATKSGPLTIKKATFTEREKVGKETKTYTYDGYALRGWLNGQRVRRQFKTHAEALTAKERLEVEAADREGAIQAVPTRLTVAQVRAAETLFELTPDPVAAVQWYLANYKPALVSVKVEFATAEFIRDRQPEVSVSVITDYRKVIALLLRVFSGRLVDSITTAELEAAMDGWGQSRKSWNNLRTYLHAFFAFCAHDSRRWVSVNPAKAVKQYEIVRGLPCVMGVHGDKGVPALFDFLEGYSGPKKAGNKPGYLVPYFALATFAGIRPSVRDGELRKIHELADKSRTIDERVGVIRMTPDLTKTNDLRQITIRPNLAKWLKAYPLSEFPLIVPNMEEHVALVRKQFEMGDDVCRHTFISMHVAKWKSLGAAALEAGNSEAIIKKHYLNLFTEADADIFWGVEPLR